jgi:hypothetical protein
MRDEFSLDMRHLIKGCSDDLLDRLSEMVQNEKDLRARLKQGWEEKPINLGESLYKYVSRVVENDQDKFYWAQVYMYSSKGTTRH